MYETNHPLANGLQVPCAFEPLFDRLLIELDLAQIRSGDFPVPLPRPICFAALLLHFFRRTPGTLGLNQPLKLVTRIGALQGHNTAVKEIGGQVDVAVGQIASINAYKGEIKPLIILDNNRVPAMEKHLPGVRTVGEAFPAKNAGAWVRGGWAVKAGTPQEIVDALVAASASVGTDEFINALPPGIDWKFVQGPEGVGAELQAGIELYSPILDGLGLLHK